MKGLLLLAAVGVGLTGCAGDAVKLKQDHSYVVEWIGERPLMDYAHLTVTLGADGRAYGNGGCNHWFAPYTVEGDKLSFGKTRQHHRTCRQDFLAHLVAVDPACDANVVPQCARVDQRLDCTAHLADEVQSPRPAPGRRGHRSSVLRRLPPRRIFGLRNV